MVKFTDLFIKRPVLAWVVSLLILLIGLRSLLSLPLQEYPSIKNTVITVLTSYPGAAPNIIEGFITSRIEKAVAQAEGIDYMTSQSTQGISLITVYVKLNFDPNVAFTNVMAKVTSVSNQLPKAAEQPVITQAIGDQVDLMYIGFNSKEMSPEQITEYVNRVIVPDLQSINGVSQAEVLGGSTFSMRIWLNPKRLAAMNISPNEITQILATTNYVSGAGRTKGDWVSYNISSKTDLHSVEQFKNIIIKTINGSVVRLKDVAIVQLGAETYDSSVTFNGEQAVFVGIKSTPDANPLTVIDLVRKQMPALIKQYPPELTSRIVYDGTEYVRASIKEVNTTIFEAVIIVFGIIFLFLGAIRSVIIPVITIPLSLIGVGTLMSLMGFSLNLLTLLAMVLAIGLVVDDAIVVVENTFRHLEEGAKPLEAAMLGAREIAMPVISMTITLAAVYAPVGFMSGLTGALFKEFAYTLAFSVIISGIIALTLSPMLCSRLLNQNVLNNRFVQRIDHLFERLKVIYKEKLHQSLNYRSVTLVMATTVLISCFWLFTHTPAELAPNEDQGIIFVSATAPQYANSDYVRRYTKMFTPIFKSFPETEDFFVVNGQQDITTVFAGTILKPWNQRHRNQNTIVPLMQEKLNTIPGLQIAAFPLPPLPVSGSNIPIQFTVKSTNDFPFLYEISQKLFSAAQNSGMFLYINNTLKYNQPQVDVNINYSKAEALSINMQSIGDALASAFGGNYVNYFNMIGQSYKVIPQVERTYRLTPEQINQIYVKTASNQSLPLSTIANIVVTTQPNNLTHFQQIHSATIEAIPMPGVTLGDALHYLKTLADKTLPQGFAYDYAGQSRQFIQEGSTLVITLFFALIIIYLVLAAQFESFRDPLIILISVPMSICGALIPLNLGIGHATMNIYTEIGLITLVGLISKHGILMVDFANHLQINQGLTVREAIEQAAAIRLRPILMTTAAMVIGVMPLIISSGAGAASRFDIGLVIATGMSIGTLFTLFVVPTMYLLLAKVKNKNQS